MDNSDAVWEHLTEDERRQFLNLVQSGDVSGILPSYQPWWRVFECDEQNGPVIVELREEEAQNMKATQSTTEEDGIATMKKSSNINDESSPKKTNKVPSEKSKSCGDATKMNPSDSTCLNKGPNSTSSNQNVKIQRQYPPKKISAFSCIPAAVQAKYSNCPPISQVHRLSDLIVSKDCLFSRRSFCLYMDSRHKDISYI